MVQTLQRSQGFSTHILNSQAISSVLVVISCVVKVFFVLFSGVFVVEFLFIMLYSCRCLVSESLIIIVFHPLSSDLVT